VCLALLAATVAAESIGIHALFGAFLLGAIVPHDSALVRDITGKLEDFVVVMLLPAFFAFAGMRTEIGLVSGAEQIFACAVIVVVASVGKFGGSLLAARATGLGLQPSMALGILMNTRGLMELIVLNVGLDLGVLSPTLYTMLTIMALVTTFATSPILDRLRTGREDGPAMTA
jgi:Kef-type K+ transport system membrane component KefB